MTIELNENQAQILTKAISSHLAELRYEISATENREYREDLKLREKTLAHIMKLLEHEGEKPAAIEPPLETIH